MNREIPVCNKICFYHELKRAWDIHENKIEIQAPIVDCQKPETLSLKATQTFRGVPTNRKNEIDRQNNFLLKKLLDINSSSVIKRTHNRHIKKGKNLPDLVQITRSQRQTKQKKIEKENEAFGSRLAFSLKDSNYSAKTFNSFREKTQNYINLISKYPYKNLHKNKTILRFEMKNSPRKYPAANRSFFVDDSPPVREAVDEKYTQVTSTFNHTKYKIVGEFKPNCLEIRIQNAKNAEDRHTLELERRQGIGLLKDSFSGSVRMMLQSVSYDNELKHFYIKLPSESE